MVGPSAKLAALSGERGIEQFVMHRAGVKTLAAFDRHDDDLGRAEQHRIDRVEVALEAPENLGKRSAEITRPATGEGLRETLRILGRPGDSEAGPPPKDDPVVGATHCGDEIGMWRTERRGAHAVDNALERNLELMRLMQRPFH